MPSSNNDPKYTDLRQQAEAILHGEAIDVEGLASDDLNRLIYELQVYQVELDLQNEELRRAQQEIEQARDRYIDLYDFAPVGYLTISDKGLIVDINLTGARLFGVERVRLIKQPVSAFIDTSDQQAYYLCLRELVNTADPCTCEVRLKEVDGVTRWVQMDGVPARGDDNQYRFTLIDITERKQTEAVMKAQQSDLDRLRQERTAYLEKTVMQLRSLNQMKDSFVDNVSHELRTPVANLKLHLHLLTLNPKKNDVYIQTLKREANRLERIVEDLLFISLWNQGQIQFNLDIVDLNTLIQTYVDDRAPFIETQDVTFSVDLQMGIPPLYIASKRIEQVLDSLLMNALNYTPAGGQIRLISHHNIDGEAAVAGFSVIDTAPPIPPEEHTKIFERFYRGESGRTSGKPGTGIGLFIAREIVEQHQGIITVTSEQGNIFKVELPLHTEGALPQPTKRT